MHSRNKQTAVNQMNEAVINSLYYVQSSTFDYYELWTLTKGTFNYVMLTMDPIVIIIVIDEGGGEGK